MLRSVSQAERILVTGGAGFIGSHLVDRLLESGAAVVCLDNLQTGRMANVQRRLSAGTFTFIEHDVTEPLPPAVTAGAFTRIYHLACAASPTRYQADPEHTMLTNVVGTAHLLRLAEQCRAQLLLTSTSEVYGDPDVHPQPEDYRGNVSCTGPRACYDEGKRAAETLAFDFHRAGRADVRVARIFNTYGPRMRRDDGRIVSNFICQALAEEPVTIHGDGTQTRSFCFVDDTVDALIRLMERDSAAGVPVNIGNPNELAVGELADLILDLTGSRSGIVRRPLPVDDPRRRCPDISRARALLGWEPRVDLRRGLQSTIAWFADPRHRANELPMERVAAE